MAEEACPEPAEGTAETADPYEKYFSYRVHYAREKKLKGGGAVVFGEEARLQAMSLEEAKIELKSFIKERAGDESLSGFKLMEIRYLKA